MALINCRNCKQQISDKAKVCPHCGQEVITDPVESPDVKVILCEECSTEIPSGADSCPNCGCPVHDVKTNNDEPPQKVELAAVSLPKFNKIAKKYVVIAAVAIVALILTIVIGTSISKTQNAKNYSENLVKATNLMLLGSIEAENAGGLIRSVWYNAIYEEYDSDTDKYTRPYGYWVNDFNDALGNLFSDSTFQATISSIKTNQKKVSDAMKDLKNPPKEYEEAYHAVKEFYNAYTTLTSLATDPKGSLQSFSQDFNAADNEALKCYNAVKIYID